jgi:hypothetical protein
VTTSTTRWIWRIATLVVVAAAGALLLAGPGQFLPGSATGSQADTRSAPCLPGAEVPIIDSPHIPLSAAAEARYNSLPPTSGPHYSFTVATGIYPDPVAEGLTVHAMEHGHVVVQYAADTPAETVGQLERVAKRYGRDVLLAPYPKLDHGIALTAWGRIELLDHFDESRATTFIEQLRGRYQHRWMQADDCVDRPAARTAPAGHRHEGTDHDHGLPH